MIKIYDDTDESTVPFDLKWSGLLIQLSVAVCLIISTLAALSTASFFLVPRLIGISLFVITGGISVVLYYLMYRSQKYPSLFASTSIFFLGLSTYLTGYDDTIGIGILCLSTLYMFIYVILIKKYNIDDPDMTA